MQVTALEDLSDIQLRELSERLRSLTEELEAQLESGAEAAKPVALDQSAVGRLSRMDAIQQQAMAKATRRNLSLRLQRCHVALEAVERGQYGECRSCEEPIGYPRLAAYPESLLCVTCQSQRA